MENGNNPLCVLLFSGKRKSGKDYFTDKLLELCGNDKLIIIKISAPIKSYFAKHCNLNLNELMSAGEYKEKYRKEMINWSESMRANDPGIFCRAAVEMFNAHSKPVWIVSDVRRKTDIKWFQENYNVVKTVRIEASDDVRRSRGWNFEPGVDDVASECDLDDYKLWDWKIKNDGQDKIFNESLSIIDDFLNKFK